MNSYLSPDPTGEILRGPELDSEKKKAFDLLDALSKSGGVPLQFTDFHVLIVATHCFDEV
jgi:hypothetical protein